MEARAMQIAFYYLIAIVVVIVDVDEEEGPGVSMGKIQIFFSSSALNNRFIFF